MARSRTVSVERIVYRTLALRLTSTALIIGLLTGISVYFTEKQSLQQQVVREVQAENHLLALRIAQILRTAGGTSRSAFQQAVKERFALPLQPQNGRFVYVDFSLPGSREYEEHVAQDYPLLDAVKGFAHARHPLETVQRAQAETVFLHGQLHVWVVLPLRTTESGLHPVAQTMFVPSAQTIEVMRNKLRRSVMQAVVVVALTSLVLYPVIMQLVSTLSRFSRNLLEANLGTLSLLASAIAKRDSDTASHNFRVTLYAVHLCQALQLEHRAIQTMIKGAFLHDVGKIGIADRILLKPDTLNEQELHAMREHVHYGLDIISNAPWLADAAQVVENHHEKFDGSGYPQGKAGTAIPLAGRIFTVVDVFDALSSRRPYKQPLSYEATMACMQEGRGHQFDPEIFDAFAGIAPELYRRYAGREDEGLRDELQILIARYFSQGEITLD